MRRSLLLVIALGAVLAACGGGGGSRDDVITASAIVRDTNAAGSARIEMRTTPPPDPEVATADSVVMSGEADFRAGAGDLRSETANASTEIRWVDGHAYMRFDAPASKGASPTALFPDLRGKWLTLDDSNDAGATSAGTVSNMFRPDFLLDVFRSASRSIRTVGHDTIRGVATTHLRIVVDGPALKKVLAAKGVPANETTTSTQSLDVWVDSRGRLRRITGVDAGSDPATTTQMDFYDYGVRVDVQPPPANEITDFPNSDQLATTSATSAPPSP